MSAKGGLRRRRQGYFVQVPRETIRDERLSYLARGVLTYLLDMPEGWVVKAEVIAAGSTRYGEGRESIRDALRELRQGGYYRLERRRLQGGQVVMGSSISEVADPEWARQSIAYWPAAVPVVEQRSGTFLVIERDGTLGPDGFIPEAPAPETGAAPDDEESGAQPQVQSIAAGQTGAQAPGSGGPGSGGPDSGGPGAGSLGPLRETEKGDREGGSRLGDPLTTRARPNDDVPVDNSGKAHWAGPGVPPPATALADARAALAARRLRSSSATPERSRDGYLGTRTAYVGRDPEHRRLAAERLAPAPPAPPSEEPDATP